MNTPKSAAQLAAEEMDRIGLFPPHLKRDFSIAQAIAIITSHFPPQQPLPVSGETPRNAALDAQLHKDCADSGQCGMAYQELALRLEKECATERAAREKREANPAVGVCVLCGSTIWQNEQQMADERGNFHPICGVKARAEAAESARATLEEFFDANPNHLIHRVKAAELRIKAYVEAVTPEAAWDVVKVRELNEDLDSRDYFDAGYKAAESKARDMESTYQFGAEVLNRIVIPRVKPGEPDGKPMELLIRWLNAAALASVPAEAHERTPLRTAAQKLLEACQLADARGELAEEIDGSLMDAVSDALKINIPKEWLLAVADLEEGMEIGAGRPPQGDATLESIAARLREYAKLWSEWETISVIDRSNLQECADAISAHARKSQPGVNADFKHRDRAHALAMLALQSERYGNDPDYRDATDNVLAWTMNAAESAAPGENLEAK